MIRKILYVLILGALWFAPLDRIEIANLEPVEAVWVYEKDGSVFIETDTEDKGSGVTVEDALSDMKQNSPAIIYLDTAQLLFVSESAEQQMDALRPLLKGAVRVCRWEGQGEFQDAVKYADAHKIGVKLKDCGRDVKLPNLPI